MFQDPRDIPQSNSNSSSSSYPTNRPSYWPIAIAIMVAALIIGGGLFVGTLASSRTSAPVADPVPAPAYVALPDGNQVVAPAGGSVTIINGNCNAANGSTSNCPLNQAAPVVVAPQQAAPAEDVYNPMGCPLTDNHGGAYNDPATKANGQCSYDPEPATTPIDNTVTITDVQKLEDIPDCTPWGQKETKYLQPGESALGDVVVNGVVRYDVGGSDEGTIVTNMSSKPVKVYAEWGAGCKVSTDYELMTKFELATTGCGDHHPCDSVRRVVFDANSKLTQTYKP